MEQQQIEIADVERHMGRMQVQLMLAQKEIDRLSAENAILREQTTGGKKSSHGEATK